MKKRMETNKQKKNNSGIIMGILNMINDLIMNALTSGFFAKLFSKKNHELLNTSLFLGYFNEANEKKERKINRFLLKAYDNSFIITKIKALVKKLQSFELNLFGSYFLSFGIYSFIVSLIKYYYSNEKIIDKYIFYNEAFYGAVFIIFISLPLFLSSKNISSLVNESILIRGVFEDALGVSKDKFIYVGKNSKWWSYFVAVILGIVSGGITYFILPLKFIFVFFIILLVGIIFYFPEIGVLVSIFSAPLLGFFDSSTRILVYISVVTLSSYLLKLVIGKRTIRFKYSDLLVLVFSLLVLLGGIISAGGKSSFKAALVYLILISIYFLVVNLLNTREWLRKCIYAISIPSIIVAFFGIINYASVTMPSGWLDSTMFSGISKRAISTFENPNMLATYLIMTSPFIWMCTTDKKIKKSGKTIFSIGSVISFCCIILTWSRGGWLGFIAAILIYSLINYKYTVKWLIVTGLCTPLLYHFIPQNIVTRFLSIGNIRDSSTYYRLFTWKGSINMLKDHLLGGVGVGSSAFNQIYPIYSYVGTEVTAHSHNLFLEIAVEIGIVGLIIFLILIFDIISKGFNGLKESSDITSKFAVSAGLSGLLAALIHGMTDHIWYNYRVFYIFWVVAALICAFVNVENKISIYKQTKNENDDTSVLNIVFNER